MLSNDSFKNPLVTNWYGLLVSLTSGSCFSESSVFNWLCDLFIVRSKSKYPVWLPNPVILVLLYSGLWFLDLFSCSLDLFFFICSTNTSTLIIFCLLKRAIICVDAICLSEASMAWVLMNSDTLSPKVMKSRPSADFPGHLTLPLRRSRFGVFVLNTGR